MTALKDLKPTDPVHQRQLTVQSYPLDDGRLLVEGSLVDDRLVAGYNWDESARPPGVVHHMVVRLLLDDFPLTIVDAEVEMPAHPHPECPETQTAIQNLIGLAVSAGFTNKVRRLIGGIQGCAHVAHLVGVMGPAALHGYWTARTRTKQPKPKSMDDMPSLKFLANSCRLWRPDGPILKRIAEEMEKDQAGSQDA